MTFSPLTHAIAFGLILWFFISAKKVDSSKKFGTTILLLSLSLILWVALSTALAVQDFYFQKNAFFLPIVIFAILPVAGLMIAYIVSPSVKGLADLFIDHLPRGHLAAIHIARVLAIGTIYKMFAGLLPAHFIVPTGIPDFIFGLSAIYVAWQAEQLSDRAFLVWNIVGLAIFGVALVTMQLSLPGPLHVINDGPTTREVVSFPMSLVPTFIAPFFITVHLVAIAKVLKGANASVRRTGGPSTVSLI
ncbi:MAG: hypothetical protein ACE5NW_06715 [Acidiferrobacterales bacterium]